MDNHKRESVMPSITKWKSYQDIPLRRLSYPDLSSRRLSYRHQKNSNPDLTIRRLSYQQKSIVVNVVNKSGKTVHRRWWLGIYVLSVLLAVVLTATITVSVKSSKTCEQNPQEGKSLNYRIFDNLTIACFPIKNEIVCLTFNYEP